VLDTTTKAFQQANNQHFEINLAALILFTFKEVEQTEQKALHKSPKTIEEYMEKASKVQGEGNGK
jgi:hypothetical protein